jgi:hypothetical protein
MAREVSTNGRKKVETLYKDFNENFPHLCLRIYPFSEKDKSTKYPVDRTKSLAEVRAKRGDGEISFSGRKNIATIEREFENVFGLYVQIGYKPASGLPEGISHYYTSGADDKKSLTQLNREKEAAGCIKGAW